MRTHRTRNPWMPRCAIADLRSGPADHPGMTDKTSVPAADLAYRFHVSNSRIPTASHSRGAFRPGFANSLPPSKSEGAGNAGRPMRPQAACAEIVAVSTRVVRSHRHHPAFPAQWFTAYNALSPATGLSCHCHLRKLFAFASLTPASGRQDHTTSPSASTPLVARCIRVHRIPFQRP